MSGPGRGLSAGHGGIRAAIGFDAGRDPGVAGRGPAPQRRRLLQQPGQGAVHIGYYDVVEAHRQGRKLRWDAAL